jgi:hypothetical protein
MSTRQRDRDLEQRPAPASDARSGDAAETRARAERLLAAADDVIDDVLSTESERFLAQNRQRGGQ